MICAFKKYVVDAKDLADFEKNQEALRDIKIEITQNLAGEEASETACDEEYVIRELAEFSLFKAEMENEFNNYRRFGCVIHILQCVAKLFEKQPDFQMLLKKVRCFVTSFNTSGVATEALVNATGRKLISDVKTRWNSVLLLVKRLIDLKSAVQIIVVQKGVPGGLTSEQWKVLESLVILLDVFDSVINSWSGDKEATIHKIVPQLRRLLTHLSDMVGLPYGLDLGDEYQSLSGAFSDLAAEMKADIEKRFACVLDVSSEKFQHIFIAATFLHGALKDGLTATEKLCASAALRYYHDMWSGKSDNFTQHQPVNQHSGTKKRKISQEFGSYASLISDAPVSPARSRPAVKSKMEIEIELYLVSRELTDCVEFEDCPRQFWLSHQKLFLVLAPVALDILSLPASSASSERMFSTAGIDTAGRSNRLSGVSLERKVLIRKNLLLLQ